MRKNTYLSASRDCRDWLRVIGLIFVLCLLGLSAGETSLPEINIPTQYGTVKETYTNRGSPVEAERTIIHLQDAHCNYEAQKNMIQVLEYLVKEQGLKLIMVEGGSGDVSLSFLRGYADDKDRQEVADKYLKEGKISGEEYLDIVSDYPIELYGIEDEALYDAHMAAFWKIDSIKKEGLTYLDNLSNIVKKLSSFIYSKELRQLGEKRTNFEDKKISLAEYCQYLRDMGYKKDLEVWKYTHLTAFCETARLEQEIDFTRAESQRNSFIEDLANYLDEQGVRDLINKSKEFKSGKLTPQEYYSFLKAEAEGKIDLERKYPQLFAYICYLTAGKFIDTGDLLEQISSIEGTLEEACFVNAAQKNLREISKSLQILAKFFNLELTPEDYEYFQANKPKFLTASWIDFLTNNCSSYNLPMRPSYSSIIDDNLDDLEGFYKLGLAREEAFIRNLTNKMDESEQKLAVLITGGFHTPGVTSMLKDTGYSYMVVAPVITERSDPSVYFSVLRGDKSQLE